MIVSGESDLLLVFMGDNFCFSACIIRVTPRGIEIMSLTNKSANELRTTQLVIDEEELKSMR